MNESEKSPPPVENPAPTDAAAPLPSETRMSRERPQFTRAETRRWWIKLCLQPALFLACGAALIAGLGVAQRLGYLTGGGARVSTASSVERYICPMMCTPPQTEPGRCPVCDMELVKAASGGGADSRAIQIDPAARRVANIHTVAVISTPVKRTIRAIGELQYDEGALKTISAYVDGRLDRLYADYTGVVLQKGDHLALVYSPKLYSSQVEFLLARKARDGSRSSTLARVAQSDAEMYLSAKERLILLGMTESQIKLLEASGAANSRMHLCAPISGTVIEKLAVEGQYVKEGDAIYKLADLSTVWLMLRLFPEDAATIRYGQKVEAEVRSLAGKKYSGRVAFIDPSVDPKTRTVGVRVVIPNKDRLLRVGDYATAQIDVPLYDGQPSLVYDPELANKWISPRHPHITATSAGDCPICGVDLVPASSFGFTDEPGIDSEVLVAPRNAVLMAGNHSVVYVETVPGRFEIRRVVLGPYCGENIVIRSGVERGEQVATRGNFLIDSQMQLAGNPSLIDPKRLDAIPTAIPAENPAENPAEAMSPEILAALSKLTPEDRLLVERQRICPVADFRLGAMGPPKKVDVGGTPVFICCDGCRASLLSEPDKYLAKLATLPPEAPAHDPAPLPIDLPPIGVPQLIEPEAPAPGAIREFGEFGENAVGAERGEIRAAILPSSELVR